MAADLQPEHGVAIAIHEGSKSSGYLIIFELWAMLGKIVMVGIFMLRKHPRSTHPTVLARVRSQTLFENGNRRQFP